MTKVTELAQKLVDAQEKLSKAEATVNAVKAEMIQELGTVTPVKAKGEKRGRKKTEDGAKYPTMKSIVQNILSKNSNGMSLSEIVKEVVGMIERHEYTSEAIDISPVVSQALAKLKGANIVNHDKESKKYSLPAA